MTAFFDDFPKISNHFPKISENWFSKIVPKIFQEFPKISQTLEEDRKMFRWNTNNFK